MTKVKLRSKPIKGSKESLFLDFYPPVLHPDTGKKTRWEYLNLYVHTKPKTILEKNHKIETLALAENIRAKRQLETQNNQYDFLSDKKRNASFISYFNEHILKRKDKNNSTWHCTLLHLKEFTKGDITFSDLNAKFCSDFRDYLVQVNWIHSPNYRIVPNTAHCYLVNFKSIIRKAYREGYLKSDIGLNVEPIQRVETIRSFLTIEELNVLVKKDCKYPVIKQAALFSALTGLRVSDIEKLTWDEVRLNKNDDDKLAYSLHYRQKKTKSPEVLPISEQAYSLLGKRANPTDRVFNGLPPAKSINEKLQIWIKRAGITKKITFHCFRHTFATLQLSAGTDLYTVSKMMGHREITTTQIYAKIVDKVKQDAADRVRLDF